MAKNEEALDADEGEEGAAGGGKKKLIIIVLLVVLLLGGVGGGLYFSGILGGKKTAGTDEAATEEPAPAESEHGSASESKGHGDKKKDSKDGKGEATVGAHTPNAKGIVYYDLPEFLVNLDSGSKQPSFLKMQVTLEVGKAEDVPKIEAVLPRVIDNINTYLRALRTSDLAGSAGMFRLKEELMLRINKNVAPAQINDVLFKEIIVQ